MRIYKLYADLSQNELKKQKLGALSSIQRAQGEIEEWNQQIEILIKENGYLKAVVNRYKKMILNFEQEYAALKVRGWAQKSKTSLHAAAVEQLHLIGSPDQTVTSDRASGKAADTPLGMMPREGAMTFVREQAGFERSRTRGQSLAGRHPEHSHATQRTALSMASHGPQGHGHVATKLAIKMLETGSTFRRQPAPFELILRMLEGFKAAMGFSKICFYPIDYNVVRLTTDNLSREAKTHLHAVDFVDKSAGAVHRLAAIVCNDTDLIKTIMFDSLKHDDPEERVLVADRGRRLALLVHQSRTNGGPCFILQAELPAPADGPTSQDGTRTHQSAAANASPAQTHHGASHSTIKQRSHSIEAASKVPKGLSHSQVMLLRIMVDAFRFRLEKLLYDHQFKAMAGDITSTNEMVGRILRVRTLKSLMRSYLREIPRLFGFEHCTVMFHDDEQDTLYQITFGDDQEKELAHAQALKKAKSEQEVEYLRVVHAMNDAMVPAEGLIRFPCTTGITGKVFATQQTIFFNNANVQSHYLY